MRELRIDDACIVSHRAKEEGGPFELVFAQLVEVLIRTGESTPQKVNKQGPDGPTERKFRWMHFGRLAIGVDSVVTLAYFERPDNSDTTKYRTRGDRKHIQLC